MSNNNNKYQSVEKEIPQGDVRNWDLFKVIPPEKNNIPIEERTTYKTIIKIVKICAYIITFGVVLGGATISKLSLLVMTSRIGPNRNVSSINLNSTSLQVPENERIYHIWLLYFAFIVPEIFTLFRSIRFLIFKGQGVPSLLEFGFPFLFETLHTFGIGLFIFCILPSLNSVQAAMLFSTLCFIPSLLNIFSGYNGSGWIIRGISIAATVFQGTIVFIWAIIPEKPEKNIWLLPISVILISFGFWDNYVDKKSEFQFVKFLAKYKVDLLENGYFSYIFISIWKIFLFLAIMTLGVHIQGVQDVPNLYSKFTDAFGFYVENENVYLEYGFTKRDKKFDVLTNPLFLNVIGSLLCYVFAKYACKICIQHVSFSAPLTLVLPLTVTLLITTKAHFFNNPFFGDFDYIEPTGNYFTKNHAWIWFFWFLSQFWVTFHIWEPSSERLARTENIFITPMYNGLLVDQSVALNRKRKKKAWKVDKSALKKVSLNTIESGVIDTSKIDDIQRIYACATMWHENDEEMLEIMKSILRMDEDQGVRRIALQNFGIMEGYYEYETHIFFDDAFQLSDPEDWNSPQILNPFVRSFISVVNESAKHVYGVSLQIQSPSKYPTPYGGRLEWTLPGKTKMIAHLKDKSKIRHKKRWSQVMYMYYLLGHRLMDLGITKESKEIRARNTYILALDGDVDFQPKAVERLVDRMKVNPRLGAACGRIHPTGGPGLMLWYQKFEYATGHWLQKATEHMIGCVLCSPGCFSLFRAKALMSDNVMARYTTMSTEPLHYVQYDQGEDRWHAHSFYNRVDYSAASDALTHAPEDFDEFFNQRRRWVPSTTANILDLLSDYKQTVKINPDISIWYIIYQLMLMFGTVMGPGTIFLMLVGALNAVFGVAKWTSFICNLIPIVVFSGVCYYCKSKTQLMFAKVLSVCYSLLMVAVVVGIAVQVSEEGLLAPSSLFLVIMASSFIISAMMHPLEFGCLIHGLVYFITIPSMYLLLMIFSVFNINNVSWGTREGPKIKSKQELLAEAKEAEEEKKKVEKGGLFSFLRSVGGGDETEGAFEFSFAGLFKLMCCTHEKGESSRIAKTLEHMSNRLEALDRKLETISGGRGESSSVRRTLSRGSTMKSVVEIKEEEEDDEIDYSKIKFDDPPQIHVEERDDMVNPYWINDPCLIKRKIESLDEREITFWNELIEKYLKPIEANKKKEKDMAEALLHLRNQCVFTFFMANSIFVLLIFMLELKKKNLNIKWPFSEKELELEPIGFTFVLFFAVILLIQFIAMLFHRFGTLSHILASTNITSNILKKFKRKNPESNDGDSKIAKEGIGLVHALMHQKSFEEGSDGHFEKKKSRRKLDAEIDSVANLQRRSQMPTTYESLDDRFEKNFDRLSKLNPSQQNRILSRMSVIDRTNRDTLNVLNNRRSKVASMRKSMFSPLDTSRSVPSFTNGAFNESDESDSQDEVEI